MYIVLGNKLDCLCIYQSKEIICGGFTHVHLYACMLYNVHVRMQAGNPLLPTKGGYCHIKQSASGNPVAFRNRA